MPTYQYACTACGEKHEAVQSFTDAPLTDCPACGGALRKVFSAVGVVFKGSGFYKTDSRKSSGDGSSTKESAKESATKTETKTDAKSDSGSSSNPAKSDGGSKTTTAPAAKSA